MEKFDLVTHKNEYSKDELKDRVEYYIKKAEKAHSLLETDGYKVAVEFFKPVWNELKAEHDSYQLVSFRNNENLDTRNYVVWVADVVSHNQGRMNQDMLGHVLYDIPDYAVLDHIMEY